jgi:uncharacterized membrane protein YdjX (TVP38/TMEM64 family)
LEQSRYSVRSSWVEGSIPWLLNLGSSVSATLPSSLFLFGAGVFLLTALLSGLGVPATIAPLSFAAGAVMGLEAGGIAVAAGGMAGNQLLFSVTRRLMLERTRHRLGARFAQIERAFGERGAWYVLSLRIVGLPGALLTGACALLPISAKRFALTSFFGLLPATFLAASVGAAI